MNLLVEENERIKEFCCGTCESEDAVALFFA